MGTSVNCRRMDGSSQEKNLLGMVVEYEASSIQPHYHRPDRCERAIN